MTKNAYKGIMILVILLAVFSVIAFVIPFAKTAVFWVAYGFGVLAILFQLYAFKSSFGNADARSRFYGLPIARIGLYYLIAQLIVSIIEFAVSKYIPAWVAVIADILILAAALIGCITTETMRDEIAKQDEKLKKDVSNMRELQSLASALASQSDDPELKKLLKTVSDEFRYSDPLTSEKTAGLEEELKTRIGDLQQALIDGDTDGAKQLCAKLSACLKERNRICSVNK